MAAIEQCRTVALGGHLERCPDCGHTQIAYNSYRHCPKCQGAVAKQWLDMMSKEVGLSRRRRRLPVPAPQA